jgi:hypothetical protein
MGKYATELEELLGCANCGCSDGSDAPAPIGGNSTIQYLSLINNVLNISNGNSVDLSQYVNTDNQQIAISPRLDSLAITSGGTVQLASDWSDIEYVGVFADAGSVFKWRLEAGNCLRVFGRVRVTAVAGNFYSVGNIPVVLNNYVQNRNVVVDSLGNPFGALSVSATGDLIYYSSDSAISSVYINFTIPID